MPADGLHITTIRCPKNKIPAARAARGIMTMPQPSCGGGASLSGRPGRDPSHEGQHPKDASLVGLGRLERPTSRLSGVRSNQLSYRPESHPKDRTRRLHPSRAKASRSRRDCLAATPAGAVIGCAKGRADGGGPLCSRRCVNIAAWAAPRAEARSTGPKGAPFRKEVIQPQVPLRLPCYDFTPVANPTVDDCLRIATVSSSASGRANSHGVTGGVYKARERIHRGVLIHDY